MPFYYVQIAPWKSEGNDKLDWAWFRQCQLELMSAVPNVGMVLREYRDGRDIPAELLARGAAVTDCNGVFFDVAHNFAGCIPGVHEVLRRQGLMAGTWCLDPDETLSEGQEQEISRVYEMYPHLNDDAFVAQNLETWKA